MSKKMRILRIGIASKEAIRQRTLDMVSGKVVPGNKEPKVWFTSLSEFARMLDEKNMICILPMTEGLDSKKAMQRILKDINRTSYEHLGIPLEVKIAGVVYVFDQYRTPNLEDFITKAKAEITDMVLRLESVQTIY